MLIATDKQHNYSKENILVKINLAVVTRYFDVHHRNDELRGLLGMIPCLLEPRLIIFDASGTGREQLNVPDN